MSPPHYEDKGNDTIILIIKSYKEVAEVLQLQVEFVFEKYRELAKEGQHAQVDIVAENEYLKRQVETLRKEVDEKLQQLR